MPTCDSPDTGVWREALLSLYLPSRASSIFFIHSMKNISLNTCFVTPTLSFSCTTFQTDRNDEAPIHLALARIRDVLPGMNAGASLSAGPSPIEGSGTAWVLLGSWALSPARPTPIPPRHECRGFSALLVIVGIGASSLVGQLQYMGVARGHPFTCLIFRRS